MLENENMIDLLGSFREMSSDQLSQLIQEETVKEAPNDELVLMALDILEDREKEEPVKLGPKGTAAWEKYQSKVRARKRKTILLWKPLMQVASVVLAITLLFALLPTQANAETWWERLARWTDDFFLFFNPNESDVPEDVYVFQTDNEGLQQVYDAVVELGVTEPIVPMWLPEGYELNYYLVDCMPAKTRLVASFINGRMEMAYHVNIYDSDKPNQYYKESSQVKSIERFGTIYNYFENTHNWTIVWTKDNIECSIFIDCQEDIIYEIIDSIYRRRINE